MAFRLDRAPARTRLDGGAGGEAPVIVGARSALFLPFADLGLVVVDEEHEGAYKQEEGVIYNARDMAVVRARFEKAPIVLASATPAMRPGSMPKAGATAGFDCPLASAPRGCRTSPWSISSARSAARPMAVAARNRRHRRSEG